MSAASELVKEGSVEWKKIYYVNRSPSRFGIFIASSRDISRDVNIVRLYISQGRKEENISVTIILVFVSCNVNLLRNKVKTAEL